MSQQVIECVIFRLVDGTDPSGFARIAEDLNTWISRQPGFIARALSCAADGEWIDPVRDRCGDGKISLAHGHIAVEQLHRAFEPTRGGEDRTYENFTRGQFNTGRNSGGERAEKV